MNLISSELSEAQFRAIRDLTYRVCGINMHEGKEGLVRTRLARRVQMLGFDGFDAYVEHVRQPGNGAELAEMIDALTTNKTSFFREGQHFDFVRSTVLPSAGNRLRIWSAGCSSGEEAVTLAMLLLEHFPAAATDARILATDISARVLRLAREGVYSATAAQDIPPAMLARHFTRQQGPNGLTYRAGDRVRSLIRFARLNLMAEWPMQGPFEMIFCRNVMIYFDRETQERLVNRFWEMLAPGGYLFVGHSESLTSLAHRFRYVQPALYVR
jgi:chemotaxis protein methyltransferase CheR